MHQTEGTLESAAIKQPVFEILALLAVLFFAAWVRCHFITNPLWLDELHTLWTVSGDWNDLATRATAGNQSPLYFTLQKLFLDCLPADFLQDPYLPVSLRILPATAGLLWIWVTFRYCTKHSKQLLLPIVVGLIQAIHFGGVYYSVEARPYSFLLLISTLLIIELLEFANKNKPFSIIRLVTLSVILFYLHYTTIVFLFFFLTVLFFQFSCQKNTKQKEWKQTLVAAGTFFVLCSPGLYQLWTISFRSELWNHFVTPERFLDQASESLALLCWPLLAWSLNVFFAKNPRSQSLNNEHQDHPSPLVPIHLIILATAPCITAYFVTLRSIFPLTDARYLISCLAAVLLLPATVFPLLSGRFFYWCSLALGILVGLLSSPLLFWHLNSANIRALKTENWQHISNKLQATNIGPDLDVILFSNLIEDRLLGQEKFTSDENFMDYCRFPLTALLDRNKEQNRTRIHPLPSSGSIRVDKELKKRLKNKRGFYLVVRGAKELVTDRVDLLSNQFPNWKLNLKPVTSSGVSLFYVRLEPKHNKKPPTNH